MANRYKCDCIYCLTFNWYESMNEEKSLEQLSSIYGFKVFKFLKGKHLTDKQIERIITDLYNAVQYSKYREHFRCFPNELLD